MNGTNSYGMKISRILEMTVQLEYIHLAMDIVLSDDDCSIRVYCYKFSRGY